MIRPATKLDASELVCLIDCAGYGIPLGVWAGMLDDEASVLEVGRKRAMREEGGFSYRNAWIAERDGAVAGALVGYRLDDDIDLSDINDVPDTFRPLMELEAEAPGSWYVNVLAVHGEWRGTGIGGALLDHADQIAATTGARTMSIIFESENDGGRRLYEAKGYKVTARRPRVAFETDRTGSAEWLLMVKDLKV
ncbi:GNAT family N-acetyltransferase [Anderseniella sp. Alg231-50]|uniref:GNAT family N-acetyltransferase n=1 Tax=Anderseniella sp. Alg231-50 TaxID=1922226 RepID=UPI00307C9E1D